MMVGRTVILTVDKEEGHPGDVVRCSGLEVKDDRDQLAVRGLSLRSMPEKSGVAGVQGMNASSWKP
ncbi:MAG: hypothetical protein R3C44_07045 [Chloroflexota bacterium]